MAAMTDRCGPLPLRATALDGGQVVVIVMPAGSERWTGLPDAVHVEPVTLVSPPAPTCRTALRVAVSRDRAASRRAARDPRVRRRGGGEPPGGALTPPPATPPRSDHVAVRRRVRQRANQRPIL